MYQLRLRALGTGTAGQQRQIAGIGPKGVLETPVTAVVVLMTIRMSELSTCIPKRKPVEKGALPAVRVQKTKPGSKLGMWDVPRKGSRSPRCQHQIVRRPWETTGADRIALTKNSDIRIVWEEHKAAHHFCMGGL